MEAAIRHPAPWNDRHLRDKTAENFDEPLSSGDLVRFSMLRQFRAIVQPRWVLFGRQLRRYDIKKRIDRSRATSATPAPGVCKSVQSPGAQRRSEEHTSELQS